MSAPEQHPPERTALYRFYDAEEMLLYIGISWQPDERWADHRLGARKEWTSLIASRTLTWFDTRAEAQAAEIAAIKDEKPLYNGTHNYESVPFDPSGWPNLTDTYRKVTALAEVMRAEITSGRWPHGHRIPFTREIAAATGLSHGSATRAVRILQSEGLLRFRHGFGVFVVSANSN